MIKNLFERIWPFPRQVATAELAIPAIVEQLATEDMSYSHVAMRLELGSITKIKADVIVNSANSMLIAGGGVDWAIHHAAGPGLQKELSTLGQCEPGQVVVTSGHNLSCNHIIHTVTPVWISSDPSLMVKVAQCYRNIFQAAHDLGATSIAIPAIGTGVHELPIHLSAIIAKDEYRKFFSGYEGSIEEVIFVMFSNEHYDVYLEEFECFRLLPRRLECLTSKIIKLRGKEVSLRGKFLVNIESAPINKVIFYLDEPDSAFVEVTETDDKLTIESSLYNVIALTLLSKDVGLLDFEGVGNVHIDGVFDDVAVSLNGKIDLHVEGRIQSFGLSVDGNGEVNSEANVEWMKISHNGDYEIEAYVKDRVYIDKNGFGDIVISGSPEEQHIVNNGIGMIRV
ncbi:MAG: macro domain-containing protein [Hafnia sp.]